eukprot:7664549-Alexandrium_andersonii.AAC.1
MAEDPWEAVPFFLVYPFIPNYESFPFPRFRAISRDPRTEHLSGVEALRFYALEEARRQQRAREADR